MKHVTPLVVPRRAVLSSLGVGILVTLSARRTSMSTGFTSPTPGVVVLSMRNVPETGDASGLGELAGNVTQVGDGTGAGWQGRGTGCQYQPTDPDDLDAGVILDPVSLPRDVDLSWAVDRVRDQGATNSCTGQAIAMAAYVRARVLGLDVQFPSPSVLYKIGRAATLANPEVPLVDSGCRPGSVLMAAQTWGLAPESLFPLDPSDINERPSWTAMMHTTGHRILDSYWVTQTGMARVTTLMTALANEYPTTLCLRADTSFLDVKPGEIVPAASGDGGNHCVTVVGYRIAGSGSIEFRILNSYGEDWGDRGYCWLSAERVADPSSFGVGVIRVVA